MYTTMKRKLRPLCALMLALVLAFASVPAQASGGMGNLYMYIQTGNSGRLHLRALPSTNSESLGLYPNGTAVLVESISGSWAFVQVNGRRGYMNLNFLSGAAPTQQPYVTPVPTEDTTLYVQTGNSGKLHLRAYASQSAKSLGLYPNGTAVHVTARSGGWVFAEIAGVSGYMMVKYLTPVSPSQPPVTCPPVTPVPGTPTLMYVHTGNSGKLHLREYPSQDSRSLGLYPNGTQLYALAMGNGWSQVMVSGQSGYMMTKFLLSSAPAPTCAPVPTYVPAPTYAPVPGGTVKYVYTGNSGRLHLRENMSTSAASLGLYYNGTPVTVIQDLGVWSLVNVYGKTGYMMNQFLTSTVPGTIVTPVPGAPTAAPTALPTSATVRQPNNSFVYLRSTRSSSNLSNVICQVPSGTVVTVLEWGGPWSRILYNGMEGYMVTNYLK